MTKNNDTLDSIMMNTDSYKQSHFKQYPDDAEIVYSYIESRGGKWNTHLFFGLQMFIKRYLTTPITLEQIDAAEEFVTMHGLPFNRDGWLYILNNHDGFLPIQIESVKEGTVLPNHNVLVQLHNTDKNVPWLTSFLETALLRAVWYPTTVATTSWHIKQVIREMLEKTSDNPEEELPFKLHDFGARGATSMESAGIGGAAHLVNFMGTDTLSGAYYARKFYNETMAGFSIPASEHSTMTCWGGPDHEVEAFENMLDKFGKKDALVACVSDSYDIYRAVSDYWGTQLKEKVEKTGGTLVVRPDSGDPTVVPIQVIEKLMEKFGYTTNSKGYRVLPDYVRVIQGDGVNIDSITKILTTMEEKGLSASNIAFGMGGALLQSIDRDTLKFAMKACAIRRNGKWYDVQKDPITDTGKRSKAGIQALGFADEYFTTRVENLKENQQNMLTPVYENGKLLVDLTFAEIREQSEK